MNFKTTYILFGVLVLMLGTLAAVLYFDPTPRSGGEKYVFPSFHKKEKAFRTEDVTKVLIERRKPDAAPLTFEKQGSDWVITSPRNMPADGTRVEELINAIIQARVDEDTKPVDRKQSGVDDPSRKITLTGKDREATLTLGTATAGGELAVVYAVSSDRPRDAVPVKRSSLATALENLNYFRAKDLLGSESPDLQALTLSRGATKVVLKKDKDRWRMVDPDYGEANITDLLTGLARLSVHHGSDKDTDFVKDGVPAAELAKYGLDKNVVRIEVTRGQDKGARTQALLVSEKKEGDKKEGEKLFATVATSPQGPFDVVKVPASAVKPFTNVLDNPEALRSKALVDLAAGQEPDAIDIEEGGNKIELRRVGTQWKLYRGTATASRVDDKAVRDLVTELTSRTAITSFLDLKSQPKPREYMGVDRPDAVTVRVYVDSLGKPDPAKPDKPVPKADRLAATLKFGLKRDPGWAVERVWGKSPPTLAFVADTTANLVRRGAVAYLEKAIDPFNPGRPTENVTKIELKRNGEQLELTRDNDKAPWTFAAPASLKGKKANDTAVTALLGSFNRPMVNAIAREKATPTELRSYGLDNPPVVVKVTVTKDKKPTTHVYEVGNEKKAEKEADKGVYLKLGGKDTIYVVNNLLLADARQELRDPTIFTFKADDAASLKITYFSGEEGALVTRTLEKKAGQWVRSDAPTWTVDQDKVKDLLTELGTLRADRFVPSAKGADDKKKALTLEVTLADKKSYAVSLGDEEGASYYASSPQHPGAAFLVPRAPFEKLKASFSYLKK